MNFYMNCQKHSLKNKIKQNFNSEYYDLDGNLQSAKRDEVNDRKPYRDIANYTKIRKCAKNSIKLA